MRWIKGKRSASLGLHRASEVAATLGNLPGAQDIFAELAGPVRRLRAVTMTPRKSSWLSKAWLGRMARTVASQSNTAR